MFFIISVMLQRVNQGFYYYKFDENQVKFRGNFGETSPIPEIPGKIFPGKFSEN